VIRPGSRSVSAARRRAALAVGALLMVACGAFRREPLDVPPGHAVVLGEIFINGFATPHLTLDLSREDGGFQEQLPIDTMRSPIVMTLPPGHYLINNLRINEQRATGPETTNFRITVKFDVGAPVVYIGTLQIERVAFLRQLRVTVKDEYERFVPAIREQYPELPAEIARSLAEPG